MLTEIREQVLAQLRGNSAALPISDEALSAD